MRTIQGSAFAVLGAILAASASADTAEHCDFQLYAPAAEEGDTSTKLLQRADLSKLAWAEENGVLYWKIEVAAHARDTWEAAMQDSVGLSMAMFCGDELIASPIIRAPLGYQFKVAGMDESQRYWK